MFPLSSDHLANFRSIQNLFSSFKAKIDSLLGRVSSLERNIGNITTTTSTSTASGEVVEKDITQVAHGFSVGMSVHLNGTTWERADADTETKVCDALVSDVASVDAFTAAISGWVTLTTGEWDAVTGGSGGLTAGDYYWLSSTAGGLTSTKPSTGLAQLVLTAVSTTTGIVTIGDVVDMDAIGSGSSYFPSGW